MKNIFDITNKDKLLYYFYRYNKKIRVDNLNKSELARMLGYKSPGHFNRDFKYLEENEFIKIKNGYYVITKKGRSALAFILIPEYLTFFIIMTGIVLVYYYIINKLGILIHQSYYLYMGITIITLGVFTYLLFIRRIKKKLI